MIKITKDVIQKKARNIWKQAGERGLLAMATGTGKSKIAVDEVGNLQKRYKNALQVLLVVPTEKLRDVTWADEFSKWGVDFSLISRECYASLHKLKHKHYHLVILDEAHRITENNSVFFKNNKIDRVLALTATEPKDVTKQTLLSKIAPTVFTYTLEEAVNDGLVAPFDIIVVEMPLDSTNKNIISGTKKKPFYQTELAKYNYLNNKVARLQFAGKEDALKFAYLERMWFVYNLPSKTRLAKKIIDTKMNGRFMVFGSSIAQIEDLMGTNVYHSKTSDTMYTKFLNGEIDSLGAVKALNEGQNIPGLDMILVVQLNSNELDIVQRIGRVVRWRPNHKAVVYILVATGTQDEAWLKKALQEFDKSTITFKKGYML